MLTEKAVLAAMPRQKDYKIADVGGLHLFVTTKGVRSWRYKYRFGGKEKLLVIGRHPVVSLKSARLARDEAKKSLSQGRDPSLEATRVKLVGAGQSEETFEQVGRRWHQSQTPVWKPVHAADVIESLERDLFPVIGGYPITHIDEPLLLAALRKVEDRGAIETARRLTKPNHPWTNGQVERMNRTIKEATVKRFHYESHDQLRTHLADFMAAYNFPRRLKTLSGLTPYIVKIWTSEPDRFIVNPIHQMPGLNT